MKLTPDVVCHKPHRQDDEEQTGEQGNQADLEVGNFLVLGRLPGKNIADGGNC